jgi:1-aminocyclopropane-1-carboxylate deaminase/D-cysteine desulfhydrase-like pyridoxal-dependent ACC family enzyme
MSKLDELDRHLADLPRVVLAHAPTPIEAMPRLTEALGGPTLLAKRDDLTGFATGGNKARQLEYSMGAAVAAGADMLLVTGAVQSNYMRTAAAAAARLGMGCHLQLEDRVTGMDSGYHENGNVLLDRLFGATTSTFHLGEDEAAADGNLAQIAGTYRSQGKTTYQLKLSADTKPLGSLGYMRCAAEILDQIDGGDAPIDAPIDAIVLASGSAATHVGMLLGLRLLGSDIPVHGICVRRDAVQQAQRVRDIIRLAEELVGCGRVVEDSDVFCHDDWFGPGYGQPIESTHEAIDLAGRLEAMIVDPVYTAKSLAGAIGLTRNGVFKDGQRVLWVHTGGLPSVFAYGEKMLG